MHPAGAPEPGHYHLHVKTISKLNGSSIQAAAAYRRAERFEGLSVTHAAAYQRAQELGNDGRVFDYRRKIGVAWTGIIAPDFTPKELQDAQVLWNTVDRIESRKNARLAREMIIALPHQVDLDVHVAMLNAFIRTHLVSRGMVADIAIHRPPVEHGGDPRNWHAHVLLTDRPMTPTGFALKKDPMWNAKENVLIWRKAWADTHNATMEHLGLPHRIDHRSLEAQRADALARGDEANAILLARLPQIHLGKAAHGTHPDASAFAQRLARNRSILKTNAAVRQQHQAYTQKRHHQAAHDALAEANQIQATEPPPRPLQELRRIYGRLPALHAMMQHDTAALADIAAKANGWTTDTPPTPSSMLGFLTAWEPTRGPKKPWFEVTARDLTFFFYGLGFISRANLQTSLEHAAEADAKRNPRLAKRFPKRRPPPSRPHHALKQRLEARLGHIQAAIEMHHRRELTFEQRYVQRAAAIRLREVAHQRRRDAHAQGRLRIRSNVPPP